MKNKLWSRVTAIGRRCICLLLASCVCQLPVCAQAAGEGANMSLVFANTGEEVLAAPCIAITEEDGGATRFVTTVELYSNENTEFRIATDYMNPSESQPADVVYASNNGFLVLETQNPVAGVTVPNMAGIDDVDITGITVHALYFDAIADDRRISDDGNYGVAQGTVNEVVTLDSGVRFIKATCPAGNAQVLGGPLVTVSDDSAVVIGMAAIVDGDMLAAVAIADIYSELEAEPDGGKSAGGQSRGSVDKATWLIPAVLAAAGLWWNAKRKKPSKQQAFVPCPIPQPADVFVPGAVTPTALDSSTPGEAASHIVGQGGVFGDNSFQVTDRVTIGRDPKRCNIVYPDKTPGVSGRHCELKRVGDGLELIDRGSSYGTFLADGTRLETNRPHTLRVGESFYLGTKQNIFKVE